MTDGCASDGRCASGGRGASGGRVCERLRAREPRRDINLRRWYHNPRRSKSKKCPASSKTDGNNFVSAASENASSPGMVQLVFFAPRPQKRPGFPCYYRTRLVDRFPQAPTVAYCFTLLYLSSAPLSSRPLLRRETLESLDLLPLVHKGRKADCFSRSHGQGFGCACGTV